MLVAFHPEGSQGGFEIGAVADGNVAQALRCVANLRRRHRHACQPQQAAKADTMPQETLVLHHCPYPCGAQSAMRILARPSFPLVVDAQCAELCGQALRVCRSCSAPHPGFAEFRQHEMAVAGSSLISTAEGWR